MNLCISGTRLLTIAVAGGWEGTHWGALSYGLLCLILLWGLLSIVYYTVKNGISPMPSSRAARMAVANEVERLIRSGYISEHDTVMEAGSGWGHMVFFLARRFPQLRMIGLENSPLPFMTASLVRRWANHSNVSFQRANFYRLENVEARLIVCYLYPGAMEPLKRTVEQALRRKGEAETCWLLSVGFALSQGELVRKVICRDLYRTPVYLYRLSVTTVQE